MSGAPSIRIAGLTLTIGVALGCVAVAALFFVSAWAGWLR